MRQRLAGFALALLASLLALPAWAAPADQADALRQFLSDPERPETIFSPTFLADVPPDKARSVASQLSSQFGKPLAVRALSERGPKVFAFDIEYERALVSMVVTVSGDGERPVIGWLVTGARVKDDSFERISSELETLPGKASILLTRIDAPGEPVLAFNANERLAIGSGFKLWVLAEAAQQVKAGKRQWSDVVPLGLPSLPSGITQDWPRASPMTLHSLATLMISLSDNTATDTLVEVLGRDNIIQQADGGNLGYPILLTREAFALKMAEQDALLARYRKAKGKDRTKILDGAAEMLVREKVDAAQLVVPRAIDSAEWFASPLDLVRTLRRLRDDGSSEALAILAINPALPPAEAAPFSYVGYKGGSETGVISHAYLVQRKDGRWYALSGIWNNAEAPVDKERFGVIVRRALSLLGSQ